MKYYHLAIITALICIVGLATAFLIPTDKVMAFDIPVQNDSANATDVILWQGDDFIVNVNMDQLETIFDTSVSEIKDDLDSKFYQLFTFMIFFCIAILGFWHNVRLLIMIAGFAFLGYGFALWTSSNAASIACVLAGMGLIVKVFWGGRRNEN